MSGEFGDSLLKGGFVLLNEYTHIFAHTDPYPSLWDLVVIRRKPRPGIDRQDNGPN